MNKINQLSEQDLIRLYEEIATIFQYCDILYKKTLQHEVRAYLVRNKINPDDETVKTLFPEVIKND